MKTTDLDMEQYDLLIDGKFVAPENKGYFDSINPSNGEVIARIAHGTAVDARSAILAARRAFDSGIWSNLTARERGQYLHRIAQLIRENAQVLAELECLDTGKT